MTLKDFAILGIAFYIAMVLLVAFANWHRKRLLRWSKKELAWLIQESEEIRRMNKVWVEETTWRNTRPPAEKRLMQNALNARADAYNFRRARLMRVCDTMQKLLPW